MNKIGPTIAISAVLLKCIFNLGFTAPVVDQAKDVNNQIFSKNNIQESEPVKDPVKKKEERNLDDLIRIWDPESVENMAKNLPYCDLNTIDKSTLYLNALRFGVYGYPLEAVECALGLPDPKERYEIGALLLNQKQVGNSMKLFETLPRNSEYNLLAIYELYSTGNPNNALRLEETIKYDKILYNSVGLDNIKLEIVPYWIKNGNVDVAKRISFSIRNELIRVDAAEEFYKSGNPKSASQIRWTIESKEAKKAATELYYKYKN